MQVIMKLPYHTQTSQIWVPHEQRIPNELNDSSVYSFFNFHSF